jgi:anthranilate synthase component I
VTDIVTRTLSADHTTPVRAYAALRSHAKGRSSFLLESTPSGGGRGRYSIVGYRVRTEAIYPGGGNAFDLLEQDIAGEEAHQDFAARVSQSLVGYCAYDIAHAMHSVDAWPDEGDAARMMRDATVVVFDSVTQTLTMAGRSKNALDRCEWEMSHGPDLPALRLPDAGAIPEFLDVFIEEAAFTEKARRAVKLVEGGDASHVFLARSFRAPMRGSDPFDVYRALRVLSPSRYHFFLEFGETPIAEGLAIAGSSDEILAHIEDRRVTLRSITGARAGGGHGAPGEPAEEAEHTALVDAARAEADKHCEPGSVAVTSPRRAERFGDRTQIASEVTGALREGTKTVDVLRGVFPSGSLMGSPKPRVTQILRELEVSPRRIWGGVVGYASPGGSLELAVATTAIVARRGYLELLGGTRIGKDTEPEAAPKASLADARAALAAVRAAQDMAKARDEAEAAARAKEQAAREKAEKEQAEKASS